jgi:hypothetical protein
MHVYGLPELSLKIETSGSVFLIIDFLPQIHAQDLKEDFRLGRCESSSKCMSMSVLFTIINTNGRMFLCYVIFLH